VSEKIVAKGKKPRLIMLASFALMTMTRMEVAVAD
jgi:hypothetical protein